MKKGNVIFLKSDGIVKSRFGSTGIFYKKGSKFIIDKSLNRINCYIISNELNKFAVTGNLVDNNFYTITENRKRLIDSL